jgi:hypothetical protein
MIIWLGIIGLALAGFFLECVHRAPVEVPFVE